MAQSLSQVYIHLIFHTKTMKIHRADLSRLWSYIAGIAQGHGSVVKIVGGEPDHVHMLSTLPRTISMSDFVEDIKRNSSHWIKSLASEYAKFSWQRGYSIYSVSHSKLDAVMHYIQNQEEHHKKISFRDEYVQWLKEYDVDFDNKYLWTD